MKKFFTLFVAVLTLLISPNGFAQLPGGQKASYTVTLNINSPDVGTVSGADTYAEGTTVTITATPSDGFIFVGWTEGGELLSQNNPFSFDISSDRTIMANFSMGTPTTYTVAISANPAAGGSVSGAGTFEENAEVTVVATPNAGYTFTNWTENDVEVSTDTIYSFTVTSERLLKANFTAKSYQITASATTGGSVTGSGSYKYDATATLTAVPETNYIFLYWTENDVETYYEPTLNLVVNGERTFVANFGLAEGYQLGSRYNPLTISTVAELCAVRDTVNAGTGTFKNIDISNGAKDKFFRLANSLDLSAICNADSSWLPIGSQVHPFKGNFNGNGNAINNLYINRPTADCQALFGQVVGSEISNLTLNNAFVIGFNNVGAICGNAQSKTTFNSCYTNGKVNGLGSSTGGICGYALSNCSLTSCSNSATISGAGAQVGGICGNLILNCQITTCANYGAVSGQNSYVGGICGFSALTSTISSCISVGTLNGTWYKGAICGLNYNATAQNCYYDMQMSTIKGINNKDKEGETTGLLTDTICGFYKFAGEYLNETYWIFADNLYPRLLNTAQVATIEAAISPILLQKEQDVRSINLRFAATGDNTTWTSSANRVAFNNKTGFLLAIGADTLVASSQNMEVKQIPIYITAIDSIIIDVDATNGTVAGDGGYLYGDNVKLVATANQGYSFVNWTENQDTVSTTSTYTFTATTNRSLKANFNPNTCTVTLNTNEGGTTTGAGKYLYNTSATITATADSAHTFLNWTNNGLVVSTNSTFQMVVTGDCSITANFKRNVYLITAKTGNIAQGSVSGSGQFEHGQMVTVSANNYYTYSFSNWTENGESVSTAKDYTFMVVGPRQLVANFTRSQYTVTLVNSEGHSPIVGGTVAGNGSYYHGETVSLSATPDEGYLFIAWMEGRDTLSTSTAYSFNITKSRTIRVCIKQATAIDDNVFELNIYPNPASERITVLGQGISKIRVFDIIGKLIYDSHPIMGEAQTTIDCSGYMPGIYMVQVTDNTGKLHVKRVVVRH